jgi:dipeptidyl aminopeptidase/acylaminoacyl peptidase
MRHVWKVAVLGAVAAGGCLPIELDVAKDGSILVPRQEGFFVIDAAGRTAKKVYAPAAGKPVFGRFSPDAARILAVTEGGGQMMGGGFEFTVVTLADGAKVPLTSQSNVTYAEWGPNGKYISISRVADETKGDIKQNLPELHVFALGEPAGRLLGSNLASLHRWMPDGESVLVFQINQKSEENDQYTGALTRVEVASGKATPLAAAIGSQAVFFDVSPDGKTVLFTALAAGKTGAELKAGKNALFLLSLADGAVKSLREGVAFALYAPDGKHVLIGAEPKDGVQKLEVTDPALANSRTLTEQATASISSGGMGGDTKVYPAWSGSDAVIYLKRTAVYGTAGVNVALVKVGLDGKDSKSLQAVIDAAAEK